LWLCAQWKIAEVVGACDDDDEESFCLRVVCVCYPLGPRKLIAIYLLGCLNAASAHGPGLSRLQQRQPGLAAEVLCRDVMLTVENVSGCCGKNAEMPKHATGTWYLAGSNEEVELEFASRWEEQYKP